MLQPLNRLLAAGTKWRWTAVEQGAFSRSKEMLASARVLAHYDPSRPTVLVTDASPHGLGVVLAQREASGEERPIAFASRSLTAAEKNYSQLDKEALGLVFGVTKFRQYLWGREFEAVTDHKPLLGLLGAGKRIPETCSPRVLRWALLLAGYNYSLSYRPRGLIAPADGLSRLPLPTTGCSAGAPAEVFMLEGVYPRVLSPKVVAEATARDPVLSRVLQGLWSGQVLDARPEGGPYESRFNEMGVHQNCVLWGNRVVVPACLQGEVLKLLHESHPGVSKMKAVARSHVWWPSLDSDIVATVQGCGACQQQQRPSRPVPLMPWPFPDRAWSRIYVDYAGPYRNSYFFIAIDAFSKWIEVFPVSSPSAGSTIACMRVMFANHGLPDMVVSDNGPAFVSEAYEIFLKKNGVKRMLVPPCHPASNGAAERAVQTMKVKLQKVGTGDLHAQIARILLTYRSTPHEVTECCPSELLMGRKLRTALDLLRPDLRTTVLQKQIAQKRDYDHRAKPRAQAQPGDRVFARNFRPGPSWMPATVTRQHNSQTELQLDDGRQWTRHLDHVRQPQPIPGRHSLCGSGTGDTELQVPPSSTPGNTEDSVYPNAVPSLAEQVRPSGASFPLEARDIGAPRTECASSPPTPRLRRSTRERRPVLRYSP